MRAPGSHKAESVSAGKERPSPSTTGIWIATIGTTENASDVWLRPLPGAGIGGRVDDSSRCTHAHSGPQPQHESRLGSHAAPQQVGIVESADRQVGFASISLEQQFAGNGSAAAWGDSSPTGHPQLSAQLA